MAELFLGGAVDPGTHQATGTEIRLGTDLFTTHGVIVGMTGSGKTGLGVVLVEEVLRAGLPALLIDPKGDLTNLALLFPGLTPEEFRPWVDEGQARAAGLAAEAFATDQARQWTEGLARWGRTAADVAALHDAVDVTIYTPGSSAGTPVNLVGSLQAPTDLDDAEAVGDEIEGVVAGLLGLVGIVADPLSSREHILLANLVDNAWRTGRAIDLPTLVGLVASPPIRKLGVFDLDQFFPPADRMALAMKLNGLLAAPSFAAWAEGPPIDIQSMLFGTDGSPRCAVVTTAHLDDAERQFVTSLLLAKLVSWTRRQSGTSDLRALVYLDEVAGYLPPTAEPPTKKPIMTLMKQARAFGVGIVLTTQNPVDVDYKALSNAGTWMIGRLQTDQDKQRLLDGMRAASGAVDIDAIGSTISGLAKREFVLRRAGKDQPEVFTTRWAMSYLRGPLTRDQIASLKASAPAAPTSGLTPPAAAGTVEVPVSPPEPEVAPDETPVAPPVAAGIAVRWVDPASPWLADVGGDPAGVRFEPAVVARVALHYDDTTSDLVHDAEYEAVLHPLSDPVDPSQAVAVDYDDRDLRTEGPPGARYVLGSAPIDRATFIRQIERDLVDHLTRSLTLELPANRGLDLVGRPGETAESFAARAHQVADARAEAEVAALRSKYEQRATRIRDQLAAAQDRTDVLEEQAKGQRNSELLSTAGSILGGLLGGKRSKGDLLGSVLGKAGTAAGRRGRTSASQRRVDAAEGKVGRLSAELEEMETELADELTEIESRWGGVAADVTTAHVTLERADVRVTQLCVAWLPVR